MAESESKVNTSHFAQAYQANDTSKEAKECNGNQSEKGSSVEKIEENTSMSNAEDASNIVLQDTCLKNSACEGRPCCDSENNDQVIREKQKHTCDTTELKTSPSSENAILNEQNKEDSLGETTVSTVNTKDLKLTLGEDVSFEQFLRKRDEPESVSSDISEQGSIHLEPLTPSEVLEHEATEILQKGNVTSSSKKTGLVSEQTDDCSKGSSPSSVETTVNQTDDNEES
uniref:Uncharacterized protein n=1 Tax=Crocodylus porosus TaxID=8502 RepID=A0A7M4EXY8_CROPO